MENTRRGQSGLVVGHHQTSHGGAGAYDDLYVVIDIYPRSVMTWTVQSREDSEIAKTMLEDATRVHGIPDAVHADRGTAMTSKPVAQLLLDLGVGRSHSRPHVSNGTGRTRLVRSRWY